MSTSILKQFMVLYLLSPEVVANWAKTDPEVKKAAEEKMHADWQRWMAEHAKMLTITAGAGKTKAVTTAGIADTKNDILLYSIAQAESHEIAAKVFASHPHLQIPQSSIQVMEVRPMGS
jgi:hypothetical protein